MKKRKLFLIFHGRFPSERAVSLFVAKNAEAFAENIETVLLVPRRLGRYDASAFEYYKIKNNFKIVFLPTVDVFWVPVFAKMAFHISHMCFSISVLIYLFFNASKKDIIYSNENLPLYIASWFFPNSFYEMHDFPNTSYFRFYKKLFKKIKGAIIHNKWKIREVVSKLSITEDKVFCEMNAVEIDQFDIDISKEDARKKLNLPQDKKIVIYTGHLYDWKGADTLASCGESIPETLIYFVGGTTQDIIDFKNRFGHILNLVFVGHRNHEEIPLWQKASDVLVIPNTAKKDISKYFTSPMKLFEYMASGRPIVASRIPSIEEIVTEREVCFFEPDDANDLALKIKEVSLGNMSDKILSALEKVKEHSWKNRAKRIIEFIDFKSK